MTRVLLAILTTLLLATPLGAANDGTPDCEFGSFAEITSLTSNSATFQVAGNTLSFDVPAGQALVFSLDGGFWVDIDYGCLEGMRVVVLKDGAVSQDNVYGLGCGSGTHHEWVPMGLETAEVSVQVTWWGCDGRMGGARGNGTAGDPPVFTPEGDVRLLK